MTKELLAEENYGKERKEKRARRQRSIKVGFRKCFKSEDESLG